MHQLVALVAILFCVGVHSSSHSEAPGTAAAPQIDATDFYLFRSYEQGRQDFVTVIANFHGLQDSYGGPNYFASSTEYFYEINFDNNGDAKEDLTFQFLFGNRYGNNNKGITLNIGGQDVAVPLKFLAEIDTRPEFTNFFEYYTLSLVSGGRDNNADRKPVSNAKDGTTTFNKPFDYAGTKSFDDYESYVKRFMYEVNIPSCSTRGKVFVGQRLESFPVNLGGIFDLVNFAPVDGASGFPGGITQRARNNIVRNKAVTTIAMELPISCMVTPSNPVLGGWTAVRKVMHDDNGDHIAGAQHNRLANPLVNEVVIGLIDKDKFNKGSPSGDATFLTYVTNPTFPEILNILFKDAVNGGLKQSFPTIAPTNFPRNDLVAVFLTGLKGLNQPPNVVPGEMMRLNTSIPAVTDPAKQNPLGVIAGDAAGFPNGRRPGDDVVDIELKVVMGRLCHLPLGLCNPADANTGLAEYTDGAPNSALRFDTTFPYLRTPLPGYGAQGKGRSYSKRGEDYQYQYN